MQYATLAIDPKQDQIEREQSEAYKLAFDSDREYIHGRTMRVDHYLDEHIHGYGHVTSRLFWDDKHAFPRKKRKPAQGRVESLAINVFSGPSLRANTRISLKIAYDIATTEYNNRAADKLLGVLYVTRDGELERTRVRGKVRPNVLYINTLFADFNIRNELVGMLPSVEEWYRKGSKGLHPQFRLPLHIMTVPSGSVVSRAAGIRAMIHEKNIHVLVLNSFEFSCTSSRQKQELLYLLKEICEDMQVTVVVCTTEPLPEFGKAPKTRGAIASLMNLAAQRGTIGPSDEDYANAVAAGRSIRSLDSGGTSYCVSELLTGQSPPPLPLAAFDDEDLKGLGQANYPMPFESDILPSDNPPRSSYDVRLSDQEDDPEAFIYDKNHPPSAWGRDDIEDG